jgi:hypothetical protein
MRTATSILKEAYPDIPLTFSFDANEDMLLEKDVSYLDFLEPHIWMCHQNGQEFYQAIDYVQELFGDKGYEALARNGRRVYHERKDHWNALLTNKITSTAECSRQVGKLLMTTECWGVVNYKDWPLLEWDWIKELCALGVRTAGETGRWMAISTSNFCGPQFRGMWDDLDWHREMTATIRNAPYEHGV